VNVARNKKMKLTKETLKQLIKEELEAVMDEGVFDEPSKEQLAQAQLRKAFMNFIDGETELKKINKNDAVRDLLMDDEDGALGRWSNIYKNWALTRRKEGVENLPQIAAAAMAPVMHSYTSDSLAPISFDNLKSWAEKTHSEM
jgi:hypothetical protein